MSPAERVFLEFVQSADSGASSEFEALCRRHADLESELRQLYDPWRIAARVLHRTESDETVSEHVESPYGKVVGPIDLAESGEEDTIPPGDGEEEEEEIHAQHRKHYRPRGQIGKGGMGIVLRVREPNLRRDLAMKRLDDNKRVSVDSSGLTADRAVHRLVEEAQITGQLVHPGIVPVHELGVDSKGRVYFTMQYVRGRRFDAIIDLARHERDGWTRARALRTIIRVCEAMAYAHTKGVIHRDLKPANIMIGRFGETYVLDWGLARVLGRGGEGEETQPELEPMRSGVVETERSHLKELTPDSPLITKDGQALGTPCYMSPEQARGRLSQLGPQSDVYSVGTLLYQLLMGQAPYWRPEARLSPNEIVDRVIGEPPSPLPLFGLPRQLVLICNKAMARDPKDRYASMMDLAHDLEAYLDGRPISLLRHNFFYVARLTLQRNRRVAMTAAAAALLVIVLIVVDLVRVRESQRMTSRLLDFASAEVLLEHEGELYPATPEMENAMQAWLDEVDQRLQRFSDYEDELAQLEDNDQSRNASRVRRAVEHMRELAALRPRVAKRLAEATSLAARSTELPGSGWDEAIRGVAESVVYDGLRVPPQVGLVPLGANEHGLWEFWHIASGARPERDPASRELELTPESGIVFVLLPGGPFEMGLPESHAANRTAPSHEAIVSPFFLSKFEVTQAQWQRVMLSEPSLFQPPSVIRRMGERLVEVEITWLHPVETVSWDACTQFAHRIHARLPTEAEWEYACRAGTQANYSWGDDASLVFEHENLLDVSYDPGGRERRDDGRPLHAPVGSYTANAFGFFDMHGNVHEWCSDLYDLELNPGAPPRRRVFRGGSWYSPPHVALSGYRHRAVPGHVNHSLGIRVARDLQR